MLELIFVIVILGIVASIGSSAIVQVYESYILQRALHHASHNAELAAMQIANRLTYRISGSVIGRQTTTGTPVPLQQIPDDSYKVLEWIAYDNDSFSAQSTPGWSGYSDISAAGASRTNIPTPGSDLSIATTIISNLGGSTGSDLALVFAGNEYNNTVNYDASCMGFTNSNCIFKPTIASNISFNSGLVSGGPSVVMRDQYKLAWTAYALVPSGNTLTLRYNYQPWNGSQSASGTSNILVENFVSFRFKGNGDTIRFKLCIQEPIGDQNITICKEKAVIR